MVYKTGAEKSLWHYNFLIGNYFNSNTDNTQNNNTRSNLNINLGVNIGKEFRKNITEKLNIFLHSALYFNNLNALITTTNVEPS